MAAMVTLPHIALRSINSRVHSHPKLSEDVQKNWNSFLESEFLATPRIIMVEKVLTIILREILRYDPELVFTIFRAGSFRERLGTILRNPKKLKRQWEHADTHAFINSKFNLDMDVMLVPSYFKACTDNTEAVLFTPSVNWTQGHVHLYMPKERFENGMVPNSLRKMCVILDGVCYITPILARGVLLEALGEASTVFQPPILKTALREHGPAVEYKIYEASQHGRYMQEFLANLTLAFHIPSWPECAQEWRERQRLWPGYDVIELICQLGCHVVPIGPLKGETLNERLEWRLSFSQAESILSDNVPQNARKVYLVVKSIFDGYLKATCNGIVSYHMKVCFLRFVEQTSPALWTDENIGEATCRLLDFVYDAINRRHCPHLFISGINLFSAMNVNEDYFKLLTAFDKIRQNPHTYVEAIYLESSNINGCICSVIPDDHVEAFRPTPSSNITPIQRVINTIVFAKMGNVPIVRDSEFIQFEDERPEISFITGNRIAFTKDNTTPRNAKNNLPGDVHNAQMATMMGELLKLANAAEAARALCWGARSTTEWRRNNLPIVSALEDSEYIFHVNTDVGFSRNRCCLTWMENHPIEMVKLIIPVVLLITIVVLFIPGVLY